MKTNFRYKKQLLIVFCAIFEQLFEKLRETLWKISSNLWKALNRTHQLEKRKVESRHMGIQGVAQWL